MSTMALMPRKLRLLAYGVVTGIVSISFGFGLAVGYLVFA